MCGVAAIFAYGANAPGVDGRELAVMGNAMRARGPDGEGLWLAGDGRAGMAHRRLAIIDLSDAAAQPMQLDSGRYRISYNGEIYNFPALRRQLEDKGHRFTTESDTEVLLRLYQEEGAGMVRRLRGMYAFALWDEERRGLLLARDPFGVKPLYYADDGSTLRAASQVKALTAGGGAGKGADAAGHVGFFLFGYLPEPHTLFADIRALPAGSTLWIDECGGRRLEHFFDPSAVLAETDATSAGAGDLRDVLKDSVSHHLIADVPVGIFLSSGLDSATITALASETRGDGLETLTLAFEEYRGGARDEAPLAEEVARVFASRHKTEWVAGMEFHHDLGDMLKAMDQPTIDGVNVYFVAKTAASMGLKVALSGLGGDEIFCGYDSFRQIPKLVSILGSLPGRSAFAPAWRAVTAPFAGRLLPPKVAGLLELGSRYGDAYLLRRGLFLPWELPQVLDADMARDGWRQLEPLIRLDDCQKAITEPRRKVAAMEAVWYMRNQLLRDADWAGMAHGVEIRVPFVDETLFRRLAPVIGRPGGPDTRAMAATPARPLPAALFNRPKTGFDVPFRDWLWGGGASGSGGERGLRGWARKVYAAAWADAGQS